MESCSFRVSPAKLSPRSGLSAIFNPAPRVLTRFNLRRPPPGRLRIKMQSNQQPTAQATKLAPGQPIFFQDETEAGVITIRELAKKDVPEVSRILVECFDDVLGYGKSFRWFLRKEVTWYLEDCLKSRGSVFVLVAELELNEDWDDPSESGSFTQPMFQPLSVESLSPVKTTPTGPLVEKTTTSIFSEFREEIDGKEPQTPSLIINSPQEQEQEEEDEDLESLVDESLVDSEESRGRLIGTIEVSIADASRSYCFLLSPPQDSAYISNMAVDPLFRRQGHASRLLNAAEGIAKGTSVPNIYLHLRVEDSIAGKLYKNFGYEIERTHSFFVRLVGQDQKHLMKKTLTS